MGLGGEPLTKINAGNTEVEYSALSLSNCRKIKFKDVCEKSCGRFEKKIIRTCSQKMNGRYYKYTKFGEPLRSECSVSYTLSKSWTSLVPFK